MSHPESSPAAAGGCPVSAGSPGGTAALRRANLSLPDVIAQSVGFIGPVLSSALVLPLVVGAGLYGAGVATPVAIILAAIGMAAIGWIISEYAERIHAAGALTTTSVTASATGPALSAAGCTTGRRCCSRARSCW